MENKIAAGFVFVAVTLGTTLVYPHIGWAAPVIGAAVAILAYAAALIRD